MGKSCKLCWGMFCLTVIGVAALSAMVFIRGNTKVSDDGRSAIIMTIAERDLVLEEMRGFLEGVEAIIDGVAVGDMTAISESAHKVGMANVQGVPVSLMAKLPLEFKTLGMDTHNAFDELAMEAADMGDTKVVLQKLGSILGNCTSCHASYRIEANSASDE